MMDGMNPITAERSVGQLIETGGIRAAYQPIVDLTTGRPVGFESLARGPEGSQLENPAQLFPAAKAAGLAIELERACLRAAFEGAAASDLRGGVALFVNLEPGLIEGEELDRLLRLSDLAPARVPVFVELTERELVRNPTQLLRAVDRMREVGLRIALDDVGADPASLALLPFVDPEVIKLDMALIHNHPRGQVAEIVHAVNAEAERTGALIVAEGIEHEHHLTRALAIGAHLGQGWHFGRPGRLPEGAVAEAVPVSFKRRSSGYDRTPFEVVSGERGTRIGDKRVLLALSMDLEAHAALHGDATVLLSTFQRSSFFTSRVGARYRPLAESLPLVGALAEGSDPGLVPGLRWAQLEASDPLVGEWDIAVIAPHFSAAFTARDLGDDGPDMDRRFEFAITYERELAVRAARSMMRRLAGAG